MTAKRASCPPTTSWQVEPAEFATTFTPAAKTQKAFYAFCCVGGLCYVGGLCGGSVCWWLLLVFVVGVGFYANEK